MTALTQHGDHYGYSGEKIPDPDAKVDYGNGEFGPMMFYYLPDGYDLKHVAATHGFDLKALSMNQALDHDDPLVLEYEDGSSWVVREWTPPAIEGWDLCAKHDTEDGPVALYIRKRDLQANT